MKITIKTSGGMGGFGLSPEATEVDVGRLPAALQKRARTALSPAHLKAAAGKPGNPLATETVTYEITIADDRGNLERVDVSEDKLSPEVLDLIDEITRARR